MKTKLECRTLILKFVDGREADFDKFRKRVLDTFTRMNIIKSELGSMWRSLEVSNWSDDIVNGIAKEKVETLRKLCVELMSLAD